MQKTILLLLTLTLILGVFSSCGYKTTNFTDTETSSSPSEDTTVVSDETTEETEAEIVTESSEESIGTTSHTETVNTTETMESIETDNGGEDETDKGSPIEYTYTVEKVGDQYYMVLNDYTPGWYPPGMISFDGYSSLAQVSTYSDLSALDMLKYGIPECQLGIRNNSYIGYILHIASKEDGIGLKLYDVDHIWKPKTLPYGWTLEIIPGDGCPDDIAVSWNGENYRFALVKGDAYPYEGYMDIHVLTESRFLEELSENKAKYEEKGLSAKTFSDGTKTVTAFSSILFITNGQYFVKITNVSNGELSEEDYLIFEFEEYLG